jgi:polysaccharide deacetylase 2 family uncharacterized protein YibQ
MAFTALMVGAAVLFLILRDYQNRPDPIELPPDPIAFRTLAPPIPVDATLGVWADILFVRADSALAELGLWPGLIAKERQVDLVDGAVGDRISVRVPGDLPLAIVNLALTQLVRAAGGQVLRAFEIDGARRVDILCGRDSIATTLFALKAAPRLQRSNGNIAIVLDDFGQMSRHLIGRFCALPQALTLAVLPNEGPIKTIVAQASAHGHQILVHLPMEPDGYPHNDPGEFAIFTNQDTTTIQRLVRQSLDKIPTAVGLNNHMGSAATADRRVMEAVLRVIKNDRRPLLFLDSVTSSASVAFELAQQMQVPAGRRDLFIDLVDDQAAVEGKLWELAELAAKKGQAIGIGHDRKHTLLALEAVLPRLESRGYRFVHISETVD